MQRLLFMFSIALGIVATPALAANPQVELDTTAGTIKLELYPEAAPKTVDFKNAVLVTINLPVKQN